MQRDAEISAMPIAGSRASDSPEVALPEIPLLSAALVRIAAASAFLAPAALGTRLASVVTRSRIETDRARTELRALGILERPLAIESLGGGRSNAVYRIRFADRTLVLKVALSEGTLLAFAARLVGPQPYARDVTAAGRIAREASALEALHAAGVRVPRVIAAKPSAGLLLVEYVAGEPLPETLHRAGAIDRIRAYAAAIGAVHAAGITLADAHPGNALVGPDGSITLIDLEFAAPAGARLATRAAFDIAYAAQYFTGAERRTFLAATGATHEVTVELAKLAGLGLLFALERRRQRKPVVSDVTSLQRAA